jgi:hypothetical protein
MLDEVRITESTVFSLIFHDAPLHPVTFPLAGPASSGGAAPPPPTAPTGMPQGGANPLQNLFANILQAAVGGIFGGGANHNQQGQSQNNHPTNDNAATGQSGELS